MGLFNMCGGDFHMSRKTLIGLNIFYIVREITSSDKYANKCL